jgi:ATP-binding cassette subfamily C protein LapB
MMQPIQRALSLFIRLKEHEVNQQAVNEIFSLPIMEKVAPNEIHLNQGKVSIKNLYFGYNDTEKLVFSELNFEVREKEFIAISGNNSSGCSTLLKLIAGIYQPTAGEVLVDDFPIYKYPSDELMKHVGYIPTHGIIFEGTIRDNVTRFGQVAFDRALEICDLLDIDKEIVAMPDGYDTMLQGRNADTITPGLRQRIAIARAIVAKPKLILFDNADRALDREGYNTIYKILGKLKRKATIIIVSDDLNLLKLADRFYVLNNGNLELRERVESDIESGLLMING